MDERAHIAEAISLAGGLSAVAKQAQPKQLTAWAVAKWLDNLPSGRVLFLAELTNWRKTPHQLCPTIYPYPNDGIPPDVIARRGCGVEAAATAVSGEARHV
ncbi:hypothetical protein ACXXNA_05780 [Bordetella bronchiseptica]